MLVNDIDSGWNDFFDSVDKIDKKEALVGYQSSGDGFGVAELAIVHEFGTKIPVTDKMRKYLATQGLFLKKSTEYITIPARPAVRTVFDNNKEEIGEQGKKLLEAYLNGKTDIELTYEIWGDFFKELFRNGIVSRSLGLQENHPFTIERKGSDTPLSDTGRLANGMETRVEDR